MGKATRWLKGFLGMKRDKENVDNNSNYGEKREKKRWSFAKSGKDSSGITPAADSVLLRNKEDHQNQHAIAVAAATAAAADAAVAAAQAAVEAVRLTGHGNGGLSSTGGKEKQAAVKIQTVFRGFLARKALRALKGIVKLQALIRGFLVRKRAAATLHSMQALFRAQAAARSQRARRSISNDNRKSREHFDEFHSKRLSLPGSYDPPLNSFDESPKIVEIDTWGPKSRRINSCMSDYGNDQYHKAPSSPVRFSGPARLSIPDCRNMQDYDWGFVTEDYKFPTAQNTPRLGRANTPVKSVCGDRFFRPYTNSPSYMDNTQSFRAKLRSYSAPKQRPELGPKKRLSLNEIMASRTSFSGVRMQRT